MKERERVGLLVFEQIEKRERFERKRKEWDCLCWNKKRKERETLRGCDDTCPIDLKFLAVLPKTHTFQKSYRGLQSDGRRECNLYKYPFRNVKQCWAPSSRFALTLITMAVVPKCTHFWNHIL